MNLKFENENRIEFEFSSFCEMIKTASQDGIPKNKIKQTRLYTRQLFSLKEITQFNNILPLYYRVYVFCSSDYSENIKKNESVTNRDIISIVSGLQLNNAIQMVEESYWKYQLLFLKKTESSDQINFMITTFKKRLKNENIAFFIKNNELLGGIVFMDADRGTNMDRFVGWIWIEENVRGKIRDQVRNELFNTIFKNCPNGAHAAIYCWNFRSINFFEKIGGHPICLFF